MKIKLFILKLFKLFIFFFHYEICEAQMDTVHYMPPVHGPVANINIPQGQFIHFSTLEILPFPISIIEADGTIVGTVIVSRSTPATYTVVNSGYSKLFVPRDSLLTTLTKSGLMFKASFPFTVSYRLRAGNNSQQAEMINSQGQAAMGTEFRAGVAPNISGNAVANEARSFFISFMATENNTEIKVKNYNSGVVFAGPFLTTINDDSLQIILNKGESYVVSGYVSDTSANLTGFVGALITASKAIVINNGNVTASIENTTSAQDILANQAVPISVLGKDYVCVRGNGSNAMERPLVIAHYNNTEIYINGNSFPVAILNEGQFFLIPDSNYVGTPHQNMYIRTSEPAYVYQPLGGSSAPTTGGMNFIPPVSCLLPTEVCVPHSNRIGNGIYTGSLTVLTQSGGLLTINGVAQSGGQSVIGLSGWETYKINNVTGSLDIQNTTPIMVGLLGFNGDAGYAGYYSGFGTKPSLNLSQLGCPPLILNATNIVTGSYQWLLNGSIISGETNNFTIANDGGDYQVLINVATCTDTSEIFNVPYLPSLANAGFDTVLCDNSIMLYANSPVHGTGLWDVISGNGTVIFSDSNQFNTTVLFSDFGTYFLNWTITNSCGSNSDTVGITINNMNVSISYLNNSYTICDTGNVSAVHSGASGGMYSVSPSGLSIDSLTGEIFLTNSIPGTYLITYTIPAIGACEAFDTATYLTITLCDLELLIPNVFTPNNDGKNDFFEIQNLDLSKKNKLQIFNRWGGLVFETESYKNDWYGTYRETENILPDGVYFYIIELIEKDVTQTGYVTIMR